jgi:protein-S-isoprenylcysteine O-methyltransferase Ste14
MTHQHGHNEAPQRHADLTGEHPAGHMGQIVLAILFIVVWVSDAFIFNYTTQLNQYLLPWLRLPLAGVLIVISYYLVKQSHAIVFHQPGGKPGVIRHGVFGLVRHPMYLSELLFYLACLVLVMSLAALAVWLLAFGFMHFIARYEEKLLVVRFGDEYINYQHEVPMWLPRLTRR